MTARQRGTTYIADMPSPATPPPSLRRELDGTHPLVVIATDDEEEVTHGA